MQDYTPSQYGEDFAHLDGASGYSLNLNDDLSSLHSGSTNLQPHAHPHSHSHQDQQGGGVGGDREDLEVLDFDQLSLNHHHPPQGQGQGQAENGEVANLYEEDFEGMLEDLNRELPPHACSFVPPVSLSSLLLPLLLTLSPYKILRYSQPSVSGKMFDLSKMVL